MSNGYVSMRYNLSLVEIVLAGSCKCLVITMSQCRLIHGTTAPSSARMSASHLQAEHQNLWHHDLSILTYNELITNKIDKFRWKQDSNERYRWTIIKIVVRMGSYDTMPYLPNVRFSRMRREVSGKMGLLRHRHSLHATTGDRTLPSSVIAYIIRECSLSTKELAGRSRRPGTTSAVADVVGADGSQAITVLNLSRWP